jgi:hypothetical protein
VGRWPFFRSLLFVICIGCTSSLGCPLASRFDYIIARNIQQKLWYISSKVPSPRLR